MMLGSTLGMNMTQHMENGGKCYGMFECFIKREGYPRVRLGTSRLVSQSWGIFYAKTKTPRLSEKLESLLLDSRRQKLTFPVLTWGHFRGKGYRFREPAGASRQGSSYSPLRARPQSTFISTHT